MRSILLLALLSSAASCSLAEQEADGGVLETLWAVDDPVAAFSTIRRGAVDGARFYAVREQVGDGRALVAYDRRDGTEVWRHTVLGPCTVVPVGGRVYCPGDYLYALDAETGRELWRHGSGAPDDSFQLVAATADARRVYAGHNGAPEAVGRVVAVDAATGTLVWERAFEGPGWEGILVQSVALSPEGDLLVAFSAEYDPPSVFSAAVLAAVDPATGEERWRVVDGGPDTDRDTGELEIWGDLVLYSDSGGQEAVAVSRTTRSVAWRAPFTPGSFSTRTAPAVVDGVAYYVDTLGGVFAVDARTGARVWSVKRPGGFFNHLACGDVLFADDQSGAVLDRQSGRFLGALLNGPDAIPGQVAAADGVLYLSASSGVYAFDCAP